MKKYPIAKADMAPKKRSPEEIEDREEFEEIKVCPMCKKDFKAGIKAAYRLGLMDGENRLKHTNNLIQKTNRALYEELTRIDEKTPETINKVILTREQIEQAIKCMRKAGKFYEARKLRKIEIEQIRLPESSEAKIRDLIT